MTGDVNPIFNTDINLSEKSGFRRISKFSGVLFARHRGFALGTLMQKIHLLNSIVLDNSVAPL